jgi:ribonuclease VapC
MIVDASAVVAILFAEADAGRYAAAITEAPVKTMSAVNWLEAAIAVDRRGGERAKAEFARFFDRAAIEIVPVTNDHAALARAAFAHWGRGTKADLNMGDCIAYALSRSTGRPLLFKGDDFTHTDIAPALPVPSDLKD